MDLRTTSCIALLLAGLSAHPAAFSEQGRIGEFRHVSGDVTVLRDGAREKAEVGGIVTRQDLIETGAGAAVGITFDDNSVFSAGPNSTVRLEEFKFDPATLEGSFITRLGKGTLSVISGDIARGSPEAMKIRTPSAILGVRGTRFLVRVEED